MSNYTLLVDNFAKLEYILEEYISSRRTKNISKKEHDKHHTIQMLLENIKQCIQFIECDVGSIVVKNANNEGKVAQLVDILKLCHQDYSLNGKTNEATIIFRTICSI